MYAAETNGEQTKTSSEEGISEEISQRVCWLENLESHDLYLIILNFLAPRKISCFNTNS